MAPAGPGGCHDVNVIARQALVLFVAAFVAVAALFTAGPVAGAVVVGLAAIVLVVAAAGGWI